MKACPAKVPNVVRTATIKHLRAFLSVARLKSFTNAAEELHMSQPSLTMAVQQLEDIIGIGLFDRTTRTVVLTGEGADFMHTAERLVADFDVAMQDIHAAAARRRGLLGIATTQSLAIKVLPHALRIFGKSRPLVRVSIWEGNSAEVRLRVRRNEVDVGFGSKGDDNIDLEFIPLFRDLMGILAHAAHPLMKRSSDPGWGDLEGVEFVGVTGDTASASVFGTMSHLPKSIVNPRYQVSNMAPLWAMIAAGNGVAVVPAFTTPDEWIGTLKFRPLNTPQTWRDVCLIKRRGRSFTPEALELIKRVKERMTELAKDDPTIQLM